MAASSVSSKDYKSDVHIDWCPGCGDFAIVTAIQQAAAELMIPHHQLAIFSGVGCSAKTPHYVRAFGAHTIHGRLFPFAIGAKLAAPELTVIGAAGDGDGLGIGVGHFVNAGRRNVDMAYLVFNNGVYGLTKGQASPTLKLGLKPKSLPAPNINEAVNPIWLAIASGFTWVGRTYAFDVKQTKEMLLRAIRHKGLAFLDVLQPCPTYNDLNTKDWYGAKDVADPATGDKGNRVYRLDERGHDPLVRSADEAEEKMLLAMERGAEWGDRIPTGVFYENPLVPTFEERITARNPSYLQSPPGRQALADAEGRSNIDFEELVRSLRV